MAVLLLHVHTKFALLDSVGTGMTPYYDADDAGWGWPSQGSNNHGCSSTIQTMQRSRLGQNQQQYTIFHLFKFEWMIRRRTGIVVALASTSSPCMLHADYDGSWCPRHKLKGQTIIVVVQQCRHANGNADPISQDQYTICSMWMWMAWGGAGSSVVV